jgi:hypothetical protein
LLDIVGSVRVKDLSAPESGIEQPEEYRAYHRYEQEAVMMLGQGETHESCDQGDRPTSDGHHDCVERAYPLLVNLEQSPELFCLQWLLSMRVRLMRLLCFTILNRLIRSLVVCMMRTTD